eukprot:3742622-Rhodomonas_salina.1
MMTLEKHSHDVMKAYNLLADNWFDSKQRSKSIKLKNMYYRLLIRKSLDKARASFLEGDELGDSTQLLGDVALVVFFQVFFLAIAANLACARALRAES